MVRNSVQALGAILGGCQSLHVNGYDEALALPSEQSALLALRTQQVVAYESGVADLVDPLGGSYAVEALTDQIEQRAPVEPRPGEHDLRARRHAGVGEAPGVGVEHRHHRQDGGVGVERQHRARRHHH